MGERQVRPAHRVPGDGRRRQGLDDRARDVRGQPAGRTGRLVQATVQRGARPHVPVADLQGAPRAWTDRDLQPISVRGGRRSAGPSGVARQPAIAIERSRRRLLDRLATTTSTRSNSISTATARRSSSSSCTCPRPSRSVASSPASTTPTSTGSSTPATSSSGATGTTYMQAYEDAITATSTAWAPWYVIPADHKRRDASDGGRRHRRRDRSPRPALAHRLGRGARANEVARRELEAGRHDRTGARAHSHTQTATEGVKNGAS